MNNKTNIIAKTLIAGLACVAFCGATFACALAAPGRGHAPGPAHHGWHHGHHHWAPPPPPPPPPGPCWR